MPSFESWRLHYPLTHDRVRPLLVTKKMLIAYLGNHVKLVARLFRESKNNPGSNWLEFAEMGSSGKEARVTIDSAEWCAYRILVLRETPPEMPCEAADRQACRERQQRRYLRKKRRELRRTERRN